MFSRIITEKVKEALKYFPAVMITGARQVGKSTLSMSLLENYITLDDVSVYSSIKEDAYLFVKSLNPPITIDEIQKIPEILLAIKQSIDEYRVNGQYILTGSANILSFKSISDTLAGRIAIFELMPLSLKEINNEKENIIDILFSEDFKNFKYKKISDNIVIETILMGGYPEIQKINSQYGRYLWFSSYISTYIERDIRIIGDLRHIDKFIKLFNVLASRSGNILNKTELSNSIDLDVKTVSNYLSLLELIYQTYMLKPYSTNFSKRFIKSGKLFFTDTGVLSHLLNIENKQDFLNSQYKGHIFETFVFSELLKSIKYSDKKTNFYYYRRTDKHEIDFILERNNKIIPIEVKFSKKITKNDFKHIKHAIETLKNIDYGFIFYMGDKLIPFGENLYAIPISILFWLDNSFREKKGRISPPASLKCGESAKVGEIVLGNQCSALSFW